MPFIHRAIEGEIKKAARGFSGLLLTGPRRSGKTTLLKKLFPQAQYFLLEDPDLIHRVQSDPRSFLDQLQPPVVLDEIQNTPELFNYIRTRMDARPAQKGQWLMTGSQEAPLMRKVSESMAGRVAIFNLLPFSLEESSKVSLLKGGLPEILSRPALSETYFRSYIQTYLERDVRNITAIKNLSTFRRFLSLLASRCGTLLNKAELAAPLGVSLPTITEWLNILEMTSQILIIPPFFENFGKRLVKTPKIYFTDPGLLCYLLGLGSQKELTRSVFLGPIFEAMVAAEIVKAQINHGRRKELYYFRDQQGLEVDFLAPSKNAGLFLLEAKASRTLTPRMAEPMNRLAKNIRRKPLKKAVVHPGLLPNATQLKTLAPGIDAVPVERLYAYIAGTKNS